MRHDPSSRSRTVSETYRNKKVLVLTAWVLMWREDFGRLFYRWLKVSILRNVAVILKRIRGRGWPLLIR